jgi:SAM-dependent methyltransferase
MIDTIKYKGNEYPLHQTKGNGTQFAFPYAKHYCKGVGYDIGCMKKEWAFDGAIPIDISFPDGFHALNLPLTAKVDYIYSSHCLEHITNWVETLNYWYFNLKKGGVLFLYLPHYEQEYWRPWNDRRHVNIFTVEIIKNWMESKNFKKIFWSERDLNHSFMIVGEK